MPDGRQQRQLRTGRSAAENSNMNVVSPTLVASRTMRGFTLVELMVTVVVLAVILALGVPSMAGFVRTSKVRSAQSELIASLMLARSEAVKRGATVGIAASSPTTGNEFNAGWTVWVDTDVNGVVDAGEPVIRDYPTLNGAVVLATIGNVTNFAFNSSGFLTPATAVSFTVCGKDDPTKGFAIRLDPVGLADVQEMTCP
jgi:type IV fimbrial biogenesis protein FimT